MEFSQSRGLKLWHGAAMPCRDNPDTRIRGASCLHGCNIKPAPHKYTTAVEMRKNIY